MAKFPIVEGAVFESFTIPMQERWQQHPLPVSLLTSTQLNNEKKMLRKPATYVTLIRAKEAFEIGLIIDQSSLNA